MIPGPGAQGFLIQSHSGTTITIAPLKTEPRQHGVGFRVSDAPGALRILPSLVVDFDGSQGPFATWEVCPLIGGGFSLRCVGLQPTPTFLAWTATIPNQQQQPCSSPPQQQQQRSGNFIQNLLSGGGAGGRNPPQRQQQPQPVDMIASAGRSRGFYASQNSNNPDCRFLWSSAVEQQQHQVVTGTVISHQQPQDQRNSPAPQQLAPPPPAPPSTAVTAVLQGRPPAAAAAAAAPASPIAPAAAGKAAAKVKFPVPQAERHLLVDFSTLPRNDEAADGEDLCAPSLEFNDGDCVHLVSVETMQAVKLRLTVEVASLQHLEILWQQHMPHNQDPHSANAIMMQRLRAQQQQPPSPTAATATSGKVPTGAAAAGATVVVGFEVFNPDKPASASASASGGHLRILPHGGAVDSAGGKGPWALFEAQPTRSGVFFRCLGHPTPTYLAAVKDGSELGASICEGGGPPPPNAHWMMLPAKSPGVFAPAKYLGEAALSLDMRCFAESGFVIVRNAVEKKELVSGALRFLNHSLGAGPSAWQLDPKSSRGAGPPKYMLPNSSHRAATSIFKCSSRLWTAAQLLLGRSNVQPVHGVQVALRFPVIEEFSEDTGAGAAQADFNLKNSTNWHIDGMEGKNILPFKLLCKVALSDQPPQHGNFTVFPGCHRRPDVLSWWAKTIEENQALMAASGSEDHLSIERLAAVNQSRPSLADVAPLQVELAPGDAVFVHPLLPHRVGANVSPAIRYSLIVRLQQKQQQGETGGGGGGGTGAVTVDMIRRGQVFDWYTSAVKQQPVATTK